MRRFFVLISVLLAGCSSVTDTTQTLYLLPHAEAQAPAPRALANRPLLVVRPVELAGYLNDNGIVYRVTDTQVVQAKHHQWAQNLSEQITQRVITDLRQKQSHYWPVPVHNLLDQRHENKLQLSLNQFNGTYQGNAELAGEWMLIDANGKVIRRSAVNISLPLQNDGYDALVSALSVGLNQLTDNLVQQW